ncbi:unnamed protein product [Peronospora destructor]|uniref:DnaJ homologue subfamily C GRV2/DNAJC13 N-terminal domain-containing protein n=1 Tax=Peronospora destructor TaxID=86335 RepID=A0AAV0V7U5_9STRA|nr:unnamed protein product [Peronospora destructor]
MEMQHVVARFMVYKVGSFVVKERVLCFGEYAFSTLDRESQQVTNMWPYEDVDGAKVLEGETDIVIYTPRHRIKKTVYRCHYRMEVLVCLLRLRSQHYAKMPNHLTSVELQTHVFESVKCLKNGVQTACVVEIQPDGIYQRDREGDVMSHISYTSLVSIDLICDDLEAISLNHSDNSSFFLVPRRTELAQVISQVMKAYGIQMNEYRKKTMEMALNDNGKAAAFTSSGVSFEHQVFKISQLNESSATSRTLSVSETYITEYIDAKTVISSRPLSRIYSLIMYQDTLQAFEVVYVDGVKRKYQSAQCEKIVCELLASCHAVGNVQVGVEMTEMPDTLRMIPRKIILQEGNKFANTVPNVNVMDRELRVAQANILQLLAGHGHRKTARTQRQLPRGLDEEMHSLAVELNVNTPTSGVIAQPSKPFDKVLYVLARELNDIVARHGATHDFVCTYLQSLSRLMLAPPAINEFMKILTEREEEYINTIIKILDSKNSVAIYWMFVVLSRLMKSKGHKMQCRQLLLSNSVFMMKLLSLLDEDVHTGSFLSDLPTMKLCQFILLLVKANAEKEQTLSETLYQHLATKYRMLLRILFSFPGLGTVEACVGILSRMTKNPAFLHFGNMGSPLRSNDGRIPRQTLSFGETLNFGPGSQRGAVAPLSSRPPLYSSRRNNYIASRGNNTFSSSAPSSSGLSGAPANVVVVQNPEVLLRQYRTISRRSMRLHEDGDRSELMSHLVGNFEEFKRVYSVDCCQFTGFIGTTDGQREKTNFYLTPRALIAVRIVTRHTYEFEYRSIEKLTQAMTIPDAFIITVKNKLKFIYSDQSNVIVEKMKTLAGVIGIHLRFEIRDKLPKQSVEKQLDHSAFRSNDIFDVQRRTGRHGSTHLRKKKLCFVDGTIEEITSFSKKVYDLKKLRRVVVPGLESDEMQAVVALEFSDCSRVVYVPYEIEKFLAALYDGRRYHTRVWRKSYQMMKTEGPSITIATNKVVFALESLNMDVEMEDFASKIMRGRLEKLPFSGLLWGINNMLEHSCKPPIRANEICVILEAFCRINDGCYRIAMEESNGGAVILVPMLAQILVSGDLIATVWAVNALHSLVTDKSRSNGHRAAEKAIRYQVFEHVKLISLLTDLLEQRNLSFTLVMLQLVLDVLVVTRHSTDNEHFGAIVKALGTKYLFLMELASQTANAGLVAAAICVLKVIVDTNHGDHKVRRRICDAALDSGLTVKHLYEAFFHPSDNAKETYQYIASIWVTYHKASHNMLVRVLPHGFIRMISNPMVRKLLRKQRARQTELQIKEVPSRTNYPGESSTDMALLSSMVCKDFLLPDLIWNEVTRGNEIKWNHARFSVTYESIAQELQVDRFYLRVIMERINDGSLQLAEVAKIVRAMEAGTHRGKLKKSSSLFFASMDIAKHPAKFFNEIYQCWLEHLHLNDVPLSGTSDWSASGSNGFPQLTGATGSEQHGRFMLKVLIELAGVFPEARPITKHRARFLTELLRNSYVVCEIQDIVELMSCLTLSNEASAELCTKKHIQVLLYMSLLSHRLQTAAKGRGMMNDHGGIPMMDSLDMSERAETSIVPIAELSFYNESRFALKWSVKRAMGETGEESVIEGPYSANELKESLDADSFIRHRQIDALYVCCCSAHGHGHSASVEHVWKSMFEHPELRWMELTEEPIDASCAAFALKTLRNFMVSDQGTVPSGNKMLWPPPLVNTIVANTSSLALLIQLLLVNNFSVRSGRIHDKRVLWSSSMSVYLQEMIDEHLHEFKEILKSNVAARYSYTPIPPISFLELSSDVYCSGLYLSTFNQSESEAGEVEDPVFLMKSIEEKWRHFVRRQADGIEEDMDCSNAYIIFGWREDATYSLSDLRTRYRELCQHEMELNTVRHAFDVLCAVLERKNEVEGGRTSDEGIERILKSQIQLLDKYGFQFFSYESSTLDLLVKALSPQSTEKSKLRILAMNVLRRLLSNAPQNGPLLVRIDGMWDAVLNMVEKCAYGHDTTAKENMFSILQLLLLSEEGVQSLLEGDTAAANEVPPSKTFDFSTFGDDDDTSFFTATEYTSQNRANRFKHAQRVYSLLDDVILSFENIQPWHIQKMSFDIASSLCRSHVLQEQIMTSTRVFWKGLYLILASAESTSGIDAAQKSITALEKQEREMLESAFGALRSLALGHDGSSRSAGLDALANLLPMDFLDCLEKPNGYDFCTILLSNIREPTCIWNGSTRAELSQLTEEFCTDPNGDGLLFLENASNHMYDCLSTEPFIGGIYLLILLEKSEGNPKAITEDTLYPTKAVDFVESLFLFLNENRDPKLGIYSDTLPALDCLSLLCDLPDFQPTIVECLEQHVDDVDPVNASISVATLGRYLLPFDNNDKSKAISISSRRSLSTYGFKAKIGSDGASAAMEIEFGNVDYLARQELALLVLNKICGLQYNLERMLSPFCQFTWCLQVIADHLDYEQAFYALSCLAELCDTCLVIAEYIQMSGLWVEMLGIALQSRQHVLHEHFLRAEALREPAFEVLYALLMKDIALREKMYNGLCRFLPYPMVYQIHLDPNKATRFFDDNHEKSDLIWNSHKRTEVRKKLDQIICRNRVERSIAKRDSVLLDDETDFIPLPQNFVAGLYINRFLSRPDPEKLTNPAYNLELLFRVWRTQLDKLMSFDLQNPPENLKTTADEIDKYTMAITHILRASLDIDESIANNHTPEQIVKLVRYCNEHLITGFPYRCILHIARRLVQFPEITSKEFVELLICRITMQHPDIPNLLKVFRRVLEARHMALTETGTKDDPEYWLKDLKYYSQMLAFLEGLVENKEQMEASLLSNTNRVLRIIHAEEPKETNMKQISRSFVGRWHNFTLESRSSTHRKLIKIGQSKHKLPVNTSAMTIESANPHTLSAQSFDVDGARERSSDVASIHSDDVNREREPSIRVDIKGIPDDREVDIDGTFIQTPPKSINFNDGAIEIGDAVAPHSFRYKGEFSRNSPLPSPKPVRYSTLGARYEPVDSQYHTKKAAEYDEHLDDEDIFTTQPRRGSVPLPSDDVGVERVTRLTSVAAAGVGIPVSGINVSNYDLRTPANRRQEPSEAPPEATTAPNASLTSLTISRRGRRAAAIYSRHKSKGKKRWFNL